MLQQKPGNAQVFRHTVNAEMEWRFISYIKLTIPKKHHFSSLQLSDPELDELEKYPSDEEPEDIPFDEVIHEDSPRRKNMPVETPVKENHGEQLPLERATVEDEKPSNNETPR